MQTIQLIGSEAKARQCALILAALRQGAVSTVAAREVLGISSPAARVYDLKRFHGLNIVTSTTTVADAQGRRHRSALYRLVEAAT